MLRYALTIFLSAFLLFQVQPLIAKKILPWFGGTPAVWTTCMLFFQILLLLGYAYAHVTTWRLTPKTQAVLHSVLLCISVLFLPIIPSDAWKPTSGDLPTVKILLLLAATVGFPYLLLSTTGPLLQKWFSRTHSTSSPYRLYALSNVGSLLALVSYPLLFEPYLRLGVQAESWSWGYGLFALMCGWCAWRAFPDSQTEASLDAASIGNPRTALQTSRDSDENVEAPRGFRIVMWLALAMVPSVMLLATTNQMCQEVAVVPFLWVLPLSLYLISFIICFDSDIWYVRGVWGPALIAASMAGCYSLYEGINLPFVWQIVFYSSLLFACCMTCHGELAKSRPHVKHLTLFYLMVAAGGALGGLFVVLAAPYLFPKYWELHIGIVAAVVMTLVSYFSDRNCYLYRGRPRLLWALLILFTVGLSGALALEAVDLDYYAKSNWERFATLFTDSFSTDKSEDENQDNKLSRFKKFQNNFKELWEGLKDVPENDDLVERTRTFYGILSVEKEWDEYGEYYSLNHGRIQHGVQYQADDMRNQKTSYYSAESGFGLAVERHPNRIGSDGVYQPMHIGVIGLGTGSTAVYGRQGDRVRYYDINPEVKRIAYEHFSYCKDSAAEVTVVLGDARVKLEQELAARNPQQFDVLGVDAFSSDAIPMHLLTRESFKLYWKHLKKDGVLAVHISNRYLDLSPVVRSLAEEAGKEPLLIDFDNPEDAPSSSASTWILVTTNEEFYDSDDIRFYTSEWPLPKLIWTDDFGSLRQVLRGDE